MSLMLGATIRVGQTVSTHPAVENGFYVYCEKCNSDLSDMSEDMETHFKQFDNGVAFEDVAAWVKSHKAKRHKGSK